MVDAKGKVVSYGPAGFELFEKQKAKDGKEDWVSIDSGPVTIGVIPLVPFLTGRRKGSGWSLVPPMQDAAHLQIEHYQQETALKSIKELTAFPMLAGNGVTPVMEGGKPPRSRSAPSRCSTRPTTGDNGQHGEWTFIEPSAESLKFLAETSTPPKSSFARSAASPSSPAR
jgi:hypothetical protein